MELQVLRFSSGEDSTNGILFEISPSCREFLCYTLEDEKRDIKIMGETRIPEGKYKITLRNEGGYTAKYKKRFPDIHKGMLWVRDVPNFEYILIHCGNTDENTGGCLLVGDNQSNNLIKKDGFIGQSTQAYKRIYSYISEAILRGEEVTIEYIEIL